MKPHPLDGAMLRFYRSDRHITEAEKLVQEFGEACSKGLVCDDDGGSLRFGMWPDVPPFLPLAVSDAVHNLRAALDCVVYELAREDSGQVQH